MTDLQLNSEFLFEMTGIVDAPIMVGAAPRGTRVIGNVTGGSFEGPRMKGKVLASGADWLVIRSDGVMEVDVRAALETDDGAVIYATYSGRIVATPEQSALIFNPETVGQVDPKDYYFRTNPLFETGDERYNWLNNIVAVGVGQFIAGGVRYKVYQIT